MEISRKEGFIVYNGFYEPIKAMPDEVLGRLFRAIFQYNIDGSEPTDADLIMPFAFFKNQFRVDANKYQARCEKNRENVKTRWSGESRKQSDTTKQSVQAPTERKSINVRELYG